MGLLWPDYLLILAVIPFLVAAYFLVLRRRRRFAVQYSSLSLIRQAMPAGFRWRRHLPFALLMHRCHAAYPGPCTTVHKRDRGLKPDHRHAGAGRFAEHVRR